MPRLGIAAKLIGVTLSLLVALTAGALLTVRHYFGQQLQEQAAREVRSSSHVLASILERTGSQLLERGEILTELPSLHAALLKEHKQLEPLLLEVKTLRTANLLWATDAQGVVLSSTGEYPVPGENLSQNPFCRTALEGKEILGFDLFQGSWWLLLSLPVKQPQGPSAPIGSVTLALLIGETYLARLSELLGVKIGYSWGEHELWSPDWPQPIRKKILSQISKGFSENPVEVSVPGQEKFLWLARRPVSGGSLPIVACPTAILGIRMDESVIRQTTRVIGWIAFLTMAAGLFFSFGTIRPITRPLKSLVKDARRIGKGDLAHRTTVQGKDEIGELAAAFNQMVEQLQVSYNELSELNRTLEERVKQRTQELEQTQAQLLRAEKLASVGQLAAGVAHELNNPLMVIMGNTQLANRTLGRGGDPSKTVLELKELMQDLDQQTQRCKLIVNNLLDFSRVRLPTRTEVDIHPLLDESLRLVGYQVNLHSIQVEKRYAKELPAISADSDQLKQVFVNIILNAVQAMPLGGTLTLQTEPVGEQVRILIQDTGMGIPEEEIAKVFDPFYTTKEVGTGTGLGLSLSYSIIQRHQGTLNLTSQIDKGTTIIIQLPLR